MKQLSREILSEVIALLAAVVENEDKVSSQDGADVGTQAAISTCTVRTVQDLLVLPVREPVGGPGGEVDFAATKFDRVLFDQFWAVYPRHVGKKAAVRAFTKLHPDAGQVAALITAIEVQRRSRQWLEGIIPHASTWLNGERWTDEPEADRPPPPNSSAAKRIVIQQRAVGPRAEGGGWRDRCTHTPECQTPTQCEAARLREVVE